jgi:small nuclear ribonucleoprotein (snRNP)-like protein
MKQAIRVQNPDGSFKIIFRDVDEKNNERHNNNIKQEHNEIKENQDNKKHEKKKKERDPRYYNPLNPDHIDIFGKDLINKELIFSLVNGESIKGKMTGFGQYEVLVESNNKKLILLKQGIIKVEVL